MIEENKKFFKSIKKYLREAVEIAVPILCLGIVVQLIVGDSLLGWDLEDISAAAVLQGVQWGNWSRFRDTLYPSLEDGRSGFRTAWTRHPQTIL